MTKSALTSAIDSALSIVITKAKVLAGLLNFTNQLYPNPVIDSETLETYTTKSGSNIDYDLTIIKQGNICYLKILLDNTTGSTLSAQSIFTWKSSEFKPKATVNGIVFSVLSGTSGSASATLFLDDSGVTLNSNLPTSPSYSSVYITYIAQD